MTPAQALLALAWSAAQKRESHAHSIDCLATDMAQEHGIEVAALRHAIVAALEECSSAKASPDPNATYGRVEINGDDVVWTANNAYTEWHSVGAGDADADLILAALDKA